jgi:hypothetical protein
MLTRLLEISDKSFDGIERPHMRFSEITSTTDDVFVDSTLTPERIRDCDRSWRALYLEHRGGQPSLRKQGVGAALMRDVIAYYRNQEQMHGDLFDL